MAGLSHCLIRAHRALGPVTGETAETGMEISAAGIDKVDKSNPKRTSFGHEGPSSHPSPPPPLAIVAFFR
jgi:hypothetical protein